MAGTHRSLQSEAQFGVPRKVALYKYLEVLRVNVQNQLVYLMDFVFRSLFLIIILFIFAHLWEFAYRSAKLTSVSGYTFPEMIWYFMFAEVIVLSHPHVQLRIDLEVKQGNIAYALTKPYSYVIYHYFFYLSEVLVRTLVNLVIGCTMVGLLVGQPPFRAESIPYLAICLLFSSAIDFCISMGIGLLAFWIEDTRSVQFIYQKLLFILGGMLLPIEVFPTFVQRLAYYLPLRFIVHGPARMFVKFDLNQWTWLATSQLLWLVALGTILTGLYRKGVKNLHVNGG